MQIFIITYIHLYTRRMRAFIFHSIAIILFVAYVMEWPNRMAKLEMNSSNYVKCAQTHSKHAVLFYHKRAHAPVQVHCLSLACVCLYVFACQFVYAQNRCIDFFCYTCLTHFWWIEISFSMMWLTQTKNCEIQSNLTSFSSPLSEISDDQFLMAFDSLN